jgi:hypothetical protein
VDSVHHTSLRGNPPVNPPIAIPALSRRLTARELVAAVAALEAARVDRWQAGQPSDDLDRQLARARMMLRHREYAVAPDEMGVGR